MFTKIESIKRALCLAMGHLEKRQKSGLLPSALHSLGDESTTHWMTFPTQPYLRGGTLGTSKAMILLGQ